MINERLNPSYDTQLKRLDAPGLSEIFDPHYEIITKSKEKLTRLLEIMPGGSIGISGSRGAGKTTLLSSFCKYPINEIKGLPVLSVMTSAPVEYKARDFILYIFALVCKEVLYLKGEKLPSSWDKTDFIKRPKLNSFYTSLQIIQNYKIIIAIFLLVIFLSVMIHYLNLIFDFVYKPTFLFSSWTELDIYIWSFILISLSILMYFGRIQFKHILNNDQKSSDIIVNDALRYLHLIRFQSSFSSGWSGSLNIPIALEGRLNSVTTLSQNQLTLPEITHYFHEFLGLIKQEYTVIIGIDELDKLQSSKEANRFLNEIKGIFGIDNCFFLISVSENALSSFDRRGLPFRDIFDSSFDEIIYVHYLELEEAKNLIARRVIGLPIPFVCFCYSMSGGLARDLIRICRNIKELMHADSDNNHLSTLCSTIIKTEIKSTLRAVFTEAKEIKSEPDVTHFLRKVYQIQTSIEISNNISELYSILKENENIQYNSYELDFLKNELESYLYFSITILEFFSNYTDKSTEKYENSKLFEDLATSRQFLAVNPKIAKSIITEFRKSNKMDAL